VSQEKEKKMQRQQNEKKALFFYFCRKKERREQPCIIPRQRIETLTHQCVIITTITDTIIL
jgi:hypothetical protein